MWKLHASSPSHPDCVPVKSKHGGSVIPLACYIWSNCDITDAVKKSVANRPMLASKHMAARAYDVYVQTKCPVIINLTGHPWKVTGTELLAVHIVVFKSA